MIMNFKEINCLIGIQHMDQRVEYIYVNWNGDISGVGRVLHTHYQQRERVRELIMAGSRQGLESDAIVEGEILTDMHTYKPSKIAENDMAYFEITHPQYPIKYYYLFTLDASWVVYDHSKSPCALFSALFTYFGSFS